MLGTFYDKTTNMVAIEGSDTTCVLPVIKKLGHNTRLLKVLVCKNFHEGVTEEKDDALFKTKP